MSISDSMVKIIIDFTYKGLFSSSSTDTLLKWILTNVIFQRWHALTKCVLALTGNYSVKSEYAVQWIKCLLTNECPNHNIVPHVISSWIEFNITQSFRLRWWEWTILMSPILPVKLKMKKINVKSQYDITHSLIYCTLSAELNIILLHWNKQHLESGIIKWGCRPLDENFHLVLMFTCFKSMQICIGFFLNDEPAVLHFGTRLTSTFKADICMRWRGIRIQWFSELPFHNFLCILAIDLLILIDVIDLSDQIIKLGKDRDDRYY